MRSAKRALVSPRVLTAVPICDGHDSAIMTINLELVRAGTEVVYLGYHRSARDIVRAAIQEDVQGIGLSSYNGGHIEFFSEVMALLRRRGAGHIGLFGGGGGTITPADAKVMKRRGVDQIFFAGTPLPEIVQFVRRTYGARRKAFLERYSPGTLSSDRQLASCLTLAEARLKHPVQRLNDDRRGSRAARASKASRIIGITGPGGVGKSTLIDELALRFLNNRPKGRLAILSHDPGLPGHGALLGDRATMIYAQDDRVFMRSLPTGGKAGGLSPATGKILAMLRQAGFELILVETAGIGEEDLPFANLAVHRQVLVMTPNYGGRLQLQKILMLEAADLVVLNKTDLAASRTAISEIKQGLGQNRRKPKLIPTMAKRHRDAGVDQLFLEIIE